VRQEIAALFPATAIVPRTKERAHRFPGIHHSQELGCQPAYVILTPINPIIFIDAN
jgi:hypothetical protein